MKTRAKRILSAALAALTAFSVFAGTDFGMTYEAQAAQASAEVPGTEVSARAVSGLGTTH